jgi:hypothetical protein
MNCILHNIPHIVLERETWKININQRMYNEVCLLIILPISRAQSDSEQKLPNIQEISSSPSLQIPLQILCTTGSFNGYMIRSPDRRTAFRAGSQFHRHPAVVNRKLKRQIRSNRTNRMAVTTVVPVPGPPKSHLHCPYNIFELLRRDRFIEWDSSQY